jgi:hypothetical protein
MPNMVWLTYARPATNVRMEKRQLWKPISACFCGIRALLPAVTPLSDWQDLMVPVVATALGLCGC